MSIVDEVARREGDYKALLKRYHTVVMETIRAARSLATGKLQVIRKASRLLEIQERVTGDNAGVLPHNLYSK
jgi:hypothetical protein